MKCDDCLNVIEEYFDAELDAPTARDVAAHLSGCAECSEAYEALKQEQAIYASYRRDVEVTSDLWAGIQARINQESAQLTGEKDAVKPNGLLSGLRGFFASLMTVPRFSPALAAAAIIFAVGTTIVVMNYLHSQSTSPQIAQGGNNNQNGGSQTETTQPSVKNEPPMPNKLADGGEIARNPEKAPVTENQYGPKNVKTSVPKSRTLEAGQPKAQPDSRSTAEQLLHDAEQKYVAAIAILNRDYDKRRSQLDAATIARFDAALQDIDHTIAATKAAVKKNPDDPIALQYMLAAYAKKVEVLKDITTGS